MQSLTHVNIKDCPLVTEDGKQLTIVIENRHLHDDLRERWSSIQGRLGQYCPLNRQSFKFAKVKIDNEACYV